VLHNFYKNTRYHFTTYHSPNNHS